MGPNKVALLNTEVVSIKGVLITQVSLYITTVKGFYSRGKVIFLLSCKCACVDEALCFPVQSYTLLCGSIPHNPDTVIVEYFCDQEKAQLYYNETKELQVCTMYMYVRTAAESGGWDRYYYRSTCRYCEFNMLK